MKNEVISTTKIKDVVNLLARSDTSIPAWIFRRLIYRLQGKNIACHQYASIKGLRNIQTYGSLDIGIFFTGFMHKADRTYLNIEGKLIVNKDFSIGRGCRIYIAKNGICTLGQGYINANTVLVIKHKLTIGDGVAIAWGCEFLDEDFHEIVYDGKEEREPGIFIDDNVWIGSGVKVLKGITIGPGNVIAANSLITKSFPEPNNLIGGNPARIIKRNISWKKKKQA